jgi:hypothetical protein
MLALGEQDDDRMWNAAARFAWGVHAAETARNEWFAEGQPVLCEQTNGVIGEHPLFRAMLAAEREAARYGSLLGLDLAAGRRRSAGGRPTGKASAPDRTATPKLRMVK